MGTATLQSSAAAPALNPEAWLEANHALLVHELARVKHLLRERIDGVGHEDHAAREEQAQAKTQPIAVPAGEPDQQAAHDQSRKALEPPAAIDQLVQLCGLSRFERDVLLLCAGVEMDSDVAALCAAAAGHPATPPAATFGIALAALPDPHWSALTPERPLRHLRLIELGALCGLTSTPLRIDERILHFLAGVNQIDARLLPVLRTTAVPEDVAPGHQAIADGLTLTLRAKANDPPLIMLSGDDAQGQEDVAAVVAEALGLTLVALASELVPAAGPEFEQLIVLWGREAMLLPAGLLIHCADGIANPSVRQLAERLPGLVILAGRERIRTNRSPLVFTVDKPSPLEQRQLWAKSLGAAAGPVAATLDVLAEQYRLSTRALVSTAHSLRDQQQRDQRPLEPAALWQATRAVSRPRLESLAQRITSTVGWNDLVLPGPQQTLLNQLVSQVQERLRVYETWGFSGPGQRGLGVSALFSGESGTGKTLAAEVLANELNLDLYRIDLSAVVSKYIGETEKNLKQVFDAAEEGGVLLLFDEADALFGKRSEVSDSKDRYANIEVGYLLQRLETFQGLAILTTNLKSALDRAFQRRLRFIVSFPFPDASQRAAIWSKVFPHAAQTSGLDPHKLAQLNVAGGNIRNIALNAAFLASAQRQPITMGHLLQAAMMEAQKIERPLSRAEIKDWV